MLNHGVSTGALFLLVGILYERRHTRLISEYGGIAKQVPWIATAFVIVTLSSIGLPSTNGFVGEFLILFGTWGSRLGSSQVFATLGAVGVIFGAVYMLLLVERVFFGKLENPHNRHLPDLSVREWFVLVPMIAFIFLMGLMPGPFLAPAKPSVDRLVQRFQAEEQRQGRGPQVGTQTTGFAARAAAALPLVPAAPAAAAPPTTPIVFPEVH
jgi:NADH-quinone oxidoreductase subunit M